MTDNCKTCKFFHGVQERGGFCQRKPPAIFFGKGETEQTWPYMQNEDWCGKFKAREEKRFSVQILELAHNVPKSFSMLHSMKGNLLACYTHALHEENSEMSNTEDCYSAAAVLNILQRRYGMTKEEAQDFFDECRDLVEAGEDPEEVLREELGLEPDYIFAFYETY